MSDSTVNQDEIQKEVDIRMIRNSLRQILNNDRSLKNKINGVIASYNAEKIEGDIKVTMTTLPINEENIFPDIKKEGTSRIFFEKAYPLNNIKKIYNTPRPDEVIYHKKHFKEKSRNTTLAHYEVGPLGENDILKYDSQKITIDSKEYFHENSDITVDRENRLFYLPEIWTAIDIKNHNFINLFDQCFLKSGTSKLLLIPIPLLSTPVFLFGTEWIEDENQRNQLIDDFYYYSKATVVHYITQKLILELKNILNNKSKVPIADSLDLVKKFNEVLCKILLPIEWEIGEIVGECAERTNNCCKCNNCDTPLNDNKVTCHRTRLNPKEPKKFYKVNRIANEKFMSDSWPVCNEKGFSDFNYSLKIETNEQPKGYLISIKTTSFKVPYQQKRKKNKWLKYGKWIHELPDYDISATHLSERLTSTFELIYQQWKQLREIEKEATRAAISQVMARNMSHNIGSHVMNKLIDKNYLDGFCIKYYGKAYKSSEVLDCSNTESISLFNNYVKCRMDYLSDISFGTPLMQTSKKVYGDVFRDLDKVRLLLENISGLGSNFKYSIKLEIKDDKGVYAPVSSNNDFALAIPNLDKPEPKRKNFYFC